MTEECHKVSVWKWASHSMHQPEVHLLVSCMAQNYEAFYQLNAKNKRRLLKATGLACCGIFDLIFKSRTCQPIFDGYEIVTSHFVSFQ